MKKQLLICLSLLMIFQFGFARPIDVNEALSIANKFCQKNNPATRSVQSTKLSLAYACTDVQTRSSDINAYYYVFNKSNQQGFIIISGESRTTSILGYSDKGDYPLENQPENFKAWMEGYKTAIKELMLEQEGEEMQKIAAVPLNTEFASSITPLLNSIAWNQGEPYNLLCPKDGSELSVTGCVATAMAQILGYHKWPERGIGSNSYTTRSKKLNVSADFSKSVYDWNNITETYSSSSSDKQNQAVALLMRDCGISVNMDYTSNESGAYSQDVPAALINHFNYDPNTQYYERSLYSETEWREMIKTELNANHPIYYSASSNSGGHAFVCDGYDTNNLFHINWGWGGMSNGYFELSTLNPATQGIGGSNGGYSINQGIIAGIQKPTGESKTTYILYLSESLTSSQSSVSRNSSFTLNSKGVWNRGNATFTGNIAMGLYQDGELIGTYASASVNDLKTNYGWNDFSWKNISIPTNIANGQYRLIPVFKATGETDWQIVRSERNITNCLDLTITGTTLTFSTPTDYAFNLSLDATNGLQTLTTIYQNKSAKIRANITNNGGEFYGPLYLYFQSASSGEGMVVTKEGATIASGETVTVDFVFQTGLAPGDYNIILAYAKGVSLYPIDGKIITATIEKAPTTAAKLALTKKISLAKSTIAQNEELTLSASVKNTGGAYYDRMIAFIFPSNGGYSVDYMTQNVYIDTNETSSITFKKAINLEPGKYSIELRYMNSDQSGYLSPTPNLNNSINFTVTAQSTDISNESQTLLNIYPNPVKDVLYINPDKEIKSLRILSISGEQLLSHYPESSATIQIPLSELPKGIYLLQIETEEGLKTQKFIKE